MISIRIRISVAVVFKRGMGCRTSVVDDASMIISPMQIQLQYSVSVLRIRRSAE